MSLVLDVVMAAEVHSVLMYKIHHRVKRVTKNGILLLQSFLHKGFLLAVAISEFSSLSSCPAQLSGRDAQHRADPRLLILPCRELRASHAHTGTQTCVGAHVNKAARTRSRDRLPALTVMPIAS